MYNIVVNTIYCERSDWMSLETQMERLQNKEKSIINENANKDSNVFNTLRDLTAGTVAKYYGLKWLPAHIRESHIKGEVHFHDLDYHPYMPMTNCCLINIEDMLNNGFKIGNAEVEPPKSIQTAAAQIAQIIANVASSQYGGCSVDRLDEILSKYAVLNADRHHQDAVTYHISEIDSYVMNMTRRDVYSAMQSLEYEINTLYSSNGQTPFVTFGFGLGTDDYSRLIQQAILDIRIKGLGKEAATAIFPKLVFSLKKGVNLMHDDPNYDIKKLAIECSTKRMYPDVLNYKALTDMIGDFKVPMGCRSFLNSFEQNGEYINSGRFNLGVTTLNLPRIAIDSGGSLEVFMTILEERMQIVKDACLYRIKRVKEARPENAPILYQYGALSRLDNGEEIDQLFYNRRCTVSVGYIGLYEVGVLLFDNDWESDDEAVSSLVSVVKFMYEQTETWSHMYDVQFSVYGTPSESLTDRFCQLDREQFGDIKDVTDKGYYTNSFHYDVRKKISPFQKIRLEQSFARYSIGGFIHYCEYPSLHHNPQALEAVWDYAYDKIGYLGTNLPIDHCYDCDFEGEFKPTAEGFVCPECGNHDPSRADVVKRTCGYLGNPLKRPMVKGRHQEIASRVKHL
ncbi:anaerobic ribonucleoside-triphosphate reductase [Macrococcus brunensis]|uniref:Anaerobic ribonucleoside-triphosphate reductase n=1 Tax=Macrococcus brunensis TaxID=198483 RepID=A0A4R6BBY2_9STAP|nr:anaerobic ribonucleoside-triphosphate reductase [Macrococcus brunensis]